MAIYAPGRRTKSGRTKSRTGRKLVASLSLTAMVDMFTVLVVFLLMNYKTTDTVLYIPKEVELPEATETKELKPAHVVTISNKELLLNKEVLSDYDSVKDQRGWMLLGLRNRLVELFRQDDVEFEKKLSTTLRKAVKREEEAEKEDNRRKITIQAGKEIDFLTIKKIMYTVTEAGAKEISFAVISIPKNEEENDDGASL